jgi:hypothetical protein
MKRDPDDLNAIGLWRLTKHRQIVELFPFMLGGGPRWLPFGRRWTDTDRLRIYHALAPFRELGEVEGVCEVILAASKRRGGRDPYAIEHLLVGLRYLDPADRHAAYRDPEEWLARVGRLTTRSTRMRPRPRLAVAGAPDRWAHFAVTSQPPEAATPERQAA